MLLKNNEWVYNKSLWYDCYKDNLKMTFLEQSYYLLYGARYVALLIIMYFDHKRKDYTEEIIHHIATISIILFSYQSSFLLWIIDYGFI